VFFNCKNEKSNKHQRIISNCISAFKKANYLFNDSSYIINPYCGTFEFNSYTNTFYPQFKDQRPNNVEEVYKTLNWNDSILKTIKKEIDLEYTTQPYYEKISQELSHVKSTWIITFSGIDDNLVFAELIKLCQPISSDDFDKKASYLKEPKLAVISLSIILNNEDIQDILIDNTITLDRTCN
jgi:hypothetical protein